MTVAKCFFNPSLHGWWSFIDSWIYKLGRIVNEIGKTRKQLLTIIDFVLCNIQYNSKTTACGGIMLLSHASYSLRPELQPEAVTPVYLWHHVSGSVRRELLSWLWEIEHSKVALSIYKMKQLNIHVRTCFWERGYFWDLCKLNSTIVTYSITIH